jgi:uncharacterized DUF497 family protein
MFEMKDVDVISLRWNEWNIAHIGREGHEATPEEVEDVVYNDQSLAQLQPNGRLFVFGITQQGRPLVAIIDQEEHGIWYCVSARTASRKERVIYQQELARRRAFQ